MTGYQWLYKGKQVQHADITGRYDEFRKDGWSIFSDGKDLNDTPPEKVPEIIVAEEVMEDSPEEFKCEVCSRVFGKKMFLMNHMRSHKE